MKQKQFKNAWWPSLLSLLTLGTFVLLAVGSFTPLDEIMKYEFNYLGNGVYEEFDYTDEYDYTKTTGKRDNKGRWQGPISIFCSDFGSYEEVTMVNGLRHGTSKTTYIGGPLGTSVSTKCYNMGVEVKCNKSANINLSDNSAYRILGEKYSWYFFSLYCFGFDSTYVESYLDTLETLLYSYEFEEAEFDSYYEDALDVLRDTPYDSIISLQSTLFLFKGFEEMKNAVLRLAVIDHYRSAGIPTYDIVTTTYPGYLHALNDSGVVDEDFEQFCTDLDDSLTSYGPLDQEDPFYVDSIDSHLFRALYGIMNMELKSTLTGTLMKPYLLIGKEKSLRRLGLHYQAILKSALIPAASSDVAQIVLQDMLTLFIKGDIIRKTLREAYNLRKGIVSLPVVTTELTGNASATSVSLLGYVVGDGGASVTSRGIAWAETYNPTTEDHALASGSGTGSFALTVDGLTEGKTYYARTYATNSAGTAYGNCIEFVATAPTGIQDINLFVHDFTVYPNPAKESATCSFRLGSPAGVTIKIIDMRGQVVLYRDHGMMPKGENLIKLDLSGLDNGLYNCQLTNGTDHVVRKLEIVR
jgi:hypothetical protein